MKETTVTKDNSIMQDIRNQVKVTLAIAGLLLLFAACGYFLAGGRGMMIALFIAAGFNLFLCWKSRDILLRLYRAKEIKYDDCPWLCEMVMGLSGQANISPPRLYLLPMGQPNAFCVGHCQQNAVIGLSQGLLELLSREELAAVIAHEIAHIRNRDLLLMMLAATISGAISLLVNFAYYSTMGGQRNAGLRAISCVLFAPLAAVLIQMLISRTREYEADRQAVQICQNRNWLIQALLKTEARAKIHENHMARKMPATAHLFLINPLGKGRMQTLFNTHPTISQRIAALSAPGNNAQPFEQA